MTTAASWWQRKSTLGKLWWRCETFLLDVCGSINTLARDFLDRWSDE